jgi:diguanylate cyclase (GGDEF)-like protein
MSNRPDALVFMAAYLIRVARLLTQHGKAQSRQPVSNTSIPARASSVGHFCAWIEKCITFSVGNFHCLHATVAVIVLRSVPIRKLALALSMSADQPQAIRILFVEDLQVDVDLALHQLKRAGISCVWRRVEIAPELAAALDEFAPDIVLSDFSLPQFDGMSALQMVREKAPAIPFLFVSGTIGEERAINALHAGAVDYVLKENLARLAPAVRRALSEAAADAQRIRQEAQIARLNRVLRMQSGINGLVLRIRDRAELLRETCRLAVSVGSYDVAIASSRVPGFSTIQPMAWSGVDEGLTEQLRAYIAESVSRDSSVIGRAIRSGKEFVCNNTADVSATATFDSLMLHTGLLSVVALPLTVDGAVIALLVLTARDSDVVGEEELVMLREVAGNLSFGLQYLQRDTTVRFLSNFDPQTGLAKRPLFCERVQRLLATSAAANPNYAVVVMDIERLSVINDSFGRRTGDLLLQQVAERLKRHYPKTDQVAHFSGGTFALVVSQGKLSSQEFEAMGFQQAQSIFSEPFVIDGRSLPVAMQTGFALGPEDGADATSLVQNAEAALRYARGAGEKHVHYNAKARSESVGQLALEHRLRLACERNEFELFYQPKVNVVTRRIQGAEALIRWRSPEDGLVAPAVFLPLMEATGLIVQVGDWVLQQAARDCQQWMRNGLPPVRVAVNIAPAQLRHPEFEQIFHNAVRSWSSKAWGLDIEITEGVLQDDSVTEVRKLKRLRDSGVRIAIDDFGTGYSSLGRLAALPIDTLKIDRCFVGQSLTSQSGASLVKTIIALARAFNMTTVAEGVEKQEELDFLWHMGCDQSQGFLHSRAVTAAEFSELLQHGKGVLMQPAERLDSDTLQSVRQ